MATGLTEEQVKRVERINTAGRSAEGLGWLVIVCAPLSAFIYHLSFVGGIIAWLVVILAGCALIYSGKYILYSDGYYNRSFLSLVLVLSLFFIGGIIPLIVTIEAIMALFAFSRLVKEFGQPERNYKELPLKNKEIIIFSILVLAGFALLFNFRSNLDNNAGNTTNSLQAGLSE